MRRTSLLRRLAPVALPVLAPLVLAALVTFCWTAGAEAGDIQTDGRLVSTVAPGTPPLAVSSSDKVDNLNADLIDGLDSAAFRFDHVIRVGMEGSGDFQSIQAAIDSIVPNPIAPERTLILVGPGWWEEQVRVPAGVLLRGVGPDLTTIRFAGGAGFDDGSAAVTLLQGALGIEDLKVSAGAGPAETNYSIGVYSEAVNAHLSGVRVRVFDADLAVVGVLSKGWFFIDDSEITVSKSPPFAAGIWNEDILRVTRSRLSSPRALYNISSSPDETFSVYVDWSEINSQGTDHLMVDDDEFSTYLRHSVVVPTGGAIDPDVYCVAVTRGIQFYADTCP